jgi:hypothetical protein
MRSYDLPGGTFGLTAEEAQMAVRKMRADALGDPSHPLLNGNHPQHQDFVRFSSELTKIILQDESDQQDALQAEKLSDARAIVGDLLPAESMARGKKLLKTPGFLDGKMPSEERAALQKEIDSCFLVGCQPEPELNTPAETEDDDDDLS